MPALEEQEEQVQTINSNEPEPEEEEIEELGSKYTLLDQLYSFLEEREEELNPVLSGYFCKLVTLLFTSKPNGMFEYIVPRYQEIAESLIHHLYQKSVSEMFEKMFNFMFENLKKLHTFTEMDESHGESIMKTQKYITRALIDKLAHENLEVRLNAQSIIQYMLELKDFYVIFVNKENIDTLVDIAIDREMESQTQRVQALSVVNCLAYQYYHIYHDLEKESKK